MAKQNNPTAPAERQGGGFTPEILLSGTAKPRALPQCPPCGRWLYSHHVSRWVVIEGVLCPDLVQMPLAGGVGGVLSRAVTRPDGTVTSEYNLDGLRANREKRGHSLIDPALGYIVGHEVVGGVAYLDQFEQPIPGSPLTEWDRVGYARWAAGLVERGVIAPPQPRVLDALIAQCTKDLAAATDRIATRPSEKVTADKIEKNLAVIRAARAAAKKEVA